MPPARPAQGAVEKSRNSALDFTKGALVLFMVLYHSLNYFRLDRGGPYLTYLRFLSPSFIFISGFLITHIYRSKYQTWDWRLAPAFAGPRLEIAGGVHGAEYYRQFGRIPEFQRRGIRSFGVF